MFHSSVLPKHVAGQAAGCPTQAPGPAVHADGQDPRVAGPARLVPTICSLAENSHLLSLSREKPAFAAWGVRHPVHYHFLSHLFNIAAS